MRLSPQDMYMSTMQAAMASALLFAGRYEEAFSWAEMAVRSRISNLYASAIAAASAAFAGRHSEAQKMMQLLQEAAPLLRLSNLKDVVSDFRPKDFERFSEGLRKAGLPE